MKNWVVWRCSFQTVWDSYRRDREPNCAPGLTPERAFLGRLTTWTGDAGCSAAQLWAASLDLVASRSDRSVKRDTPITRLPFGVDVDSVAASGARNWNVVRTRLSVGGLLPGRICVSALDTGRGHLYRLKIGSFVVSRRAVLCDQPVRQATWRAKNPCPDCEGSTTVLALTILLHLPPATSAGATLRIPPPAIRCDDGSSPWDPAGRPRLRCSIDGCYYGEPICWDWRLDHCFDPETGDDLGNCTFNTELCKGVLSCFSLYLYCDGEFACTGGDPCSEGSCTTASPTPG